MDKRQIAAAMILGLLLPGIFRNVGSRSIALPEGTSEPAGTEAPEPTETRQAVYLPVLVEPGSVKMLELEEYVCGVVLAEMPASFEEEALKAQAVVARTYALRRLEQGDRHSEAVICADSACCQAYLSREAYLQSRGTAADADKIARAVEATAGLVLTYNGALIDATYFSCSGGRTEDAAAVWGTDIPYLQSVASPGEENAAPYRKQLTFTPAEFSAALGRELTGSPESWLGMAAYTEGGGVASMVIGGISYTGTELRRLLGLNSTAFTMTAENGGITVETLGKGHRVGMSQYGADAMAATGSTCAEILSYYYPGTRIDKWSAMG